LEDFIASKNEGIQMPEQSPGCKLL